MSRSIAIFNGRVVLSDSVEIASAVILIEQGRVVAVGASDRVVLPATALLLDAEQGFISAGDIDANGRPVAPGQAADLVCHTRFGDMAWVMEAGVIVYPPGFQSPPAALVWRQRRHAAIDIVIAYLHQRAETVHIQDVSAIPGFRKKGVDILWRFQTEAADAQSLSICVIPTLDDGPARIFILDGKSARKLPSASLSATRAHWCFYHHGPDNAIYCLPAPALRRWMDRHANEIPTTPLQTEGVAFRLSGRAIPVERLQRDIPKTRIIQL